MPLLPDKFYHIYNRGNNGEKLFLNDSDYKEFLSKYDHYLGEFCVTYSYCLLPDHFHFLVRINDSTDPSYPKIVSNRFRIFFQQYAQYFNRAYGRRGSLFTKYFRRIVVDTDDYLRRLVFYIHHNPQKHQYIDIFQDYKYSSYNAFCSEKPSKLKRNEVLSWYNDDLDEFIEFHDVLKEEWIIKHLILEED